MPFPWILVSAITTYRGIYQGSICLQRVTILRPPRGRDWGASLLGKEKKKKARKTWQKYSSAYPTNTPFKVMETT